MGEPNVAIGESELNLIGEYVQSHLPGWIERLGVRAPAHPVTNTQLLERVIMTMSTTLLVIGWRLTSV